MAKDPLIVHANTELDLLGYPTLTREQIRTHDNADIAWDAKMRKSIMEVITAVSKQGHSGDSAMMFLQFINQLLQRKPLSPLTNNPNEWSKVPSELIPAGANSNLWQSKRNPEAFSNDGGKTFYVFAKKTRIGKRLAKLPASRFRSWVWKHKSWVYIINTAKEASK